MNDWKNDTKEKIDAKEQGLFVPVRQLSFVVAGILLILFASFMAGYFLGQRQVVEQFTQQVHHDSFGDQIYASLFSLELQNEDVQQKMRVVSTDATVLQQNSTPVVSEIKQELTEGSYYAQLVGFGTKKAAERFVQHLVKKNIVSEVKKRISKTAKGKVISWYQVVTPTYSDKVELEALVAKLVKEEKLNDTRIVACHVNHRTKGRLTV